MYNRLLQRPLLLCLLTLGCTHTTLLGLPKEHTHVRSKFSKAERKKVASKDQAESEPTFWQATQESIEARGKAWLWSINPVSFAVSFAFTFCITHFLIDGVLKQALQSGQFNNIPLPSINDNTWKFFASEGALFYALQAFGSLLHTGVLAPILASLSDYNMLYRFLTITFSTAFIGTSLMLHPLTSLLILIPTTLCLSFLTCPEDSEKSTYAMTNIFFLMFSWGVLQTAQYVFVHTHRLDDFLTTCGLQWQGIAGKKEQLRNLLMCHGNLGVFKLWETLKNYLFVPQGGNQYMTLQQLLAQHQDGFWLKPVLDYVNGLSSPLKEIFQGIMQNVLFDLAKDLFL